MSKLWIIHPNDNTTLFLAGITNFLVEKLGHNLILINIEANTDSHHKCIKELSKTSKTDFIVFLGHGSSKQLVGARGESFVEETFIDQYNLKTLSNRNVLFLSCRSADFLKDKTYLKCAIGFGDIPTESEEIEMLQRINNIYDNVLEETLERFKTLLCDIIKESILDVCVFNESPLFLFNRIKLRINKQIFVTLLNRNDEQSRKLSYLLYVMKKEIRIYGDIYSTIGLNMT